MKPERGIVLLIILLLITPPVLANYNRIGEFGIAHDVCRKEGTEYCWTYVQFEEPFSTEPVVIVRDDYASFDYGTTAATTIPTKARVGNVNTTGFLVRTESWDDFASTENNAPPNATIEVFWVAILPGIHNLSNAGTPQRVIEVGTFLGDQAECTPKGSFDNVNNQRSFQYNWSSQPYLYLDVQTSNNGDAIEMMGGPLTGCGTPIGTTYTASCFTYGLTELEQTGHCNNVTQNETLGYIALEAGSGYNSETRYTYSIGNETVTHQLELFWESDNVRGLDNDLSPANSYSVALSQSWTEGIALGQNTEIDGGDGVYPAIAYTAGDNSVYELSIEDGTDNEKAHTPEPFMVLFINASNGTFFNEFLLDETPPNVTNLDATPDPVEVESTVNISAQVTDLSNIGTVLIEVTEPNGTMSNYTTSGAYWNETVPTSQTGLHTFRLYANDTEGNSNASETGTFSVEASPPTVENLTAIPSPAEVYQQFNISANVSSPTSLDTVLIELTFPNGTRENITTQNAGSIYWQVINNTQLGIYSYRIHANNTYGTSNASESDTVLSQDTIPPNVTSPNASPDPVDIFSAVNISAQVIDIFQVFIVNIEVTFPNGSQQNFSTTGSTIFYNESINTTQIGTHTYRIHAMDTALNMNSSVIGTFEVQDTIVPAVLALNAQNQTIGGSVNISASVTDLVGLDTVVVEITEPSSTRTNYSTQANGNTYNNISIPDEIGMHSYIIYANDTSGNLNDSETGIFIIQSIIPPNVTGLDADPNPVEVYGTVNISANVEDSTGMDIVIIELTHPNGTNENLTTESTGDVYWNITGASQTGLYSYRIYANNTNGESNTSETANFTSQDTQSPDVFGLNAIPAIAELFSPVNISANATDNVQVLSVNIEITYPNGTQENISTTQSSYTYYNETATSHVGLHMFRIYATDSSSNVNSTSTGNFTVQDTIPPAITNMSATPDPVDVLQQINISAIVTSGDGVDDVIIEVETPLGAKANYTTVSSGNEYYNYTIIPISDGNYTYTIYANDTNGNKESNSSTFSATIPIPEITLLAPLPNAGTDRNATFVYKINSSESVTNCSLMFNDQTQAVNTSVTANIPQEFVSYLPLGSANWSVNCTTVSSEVQSPIYKITVLNLTYFGGNTTNLSEVNISNVPNLVIELPGSGTIAFTTNVSLEGSPDLSAYINITPNAVTIDSENLPNLNVSAEITLYDRNLQNPIILVDGVFCTNCNIIENNEDIRFSVQHFSTYVASENSQLFINDTSDSEIVHSTEQVNFFANYSNITNGAPIVGDCNISFADIGLQDMPYNSTSSLYEYNRTFSTEGVFFYNVTCNGVGFATLNATDTVSVSAAEGPTGVSDISLVRSESANDSYSPAPVEARGGNVSEFDIVGKSITTAWTGFFGQLNGTIQLQQENNNVFFSWNITNPSGEVYASRVPDVNFITITCANSSHIAQEEAFVGQSNETSDSVTRTFNNTLHPGFSVGTVAIANDSCSSTNTYVDSQPQTNAFYEMLLVDGAENMVYTTLLYSDQTGFDNNTYDFQMLVSVNTSVAIGVVPYYFFVEIS